VCVLPMSKGHTLKGNSTIVLLALLCINERCHVRSRDEKFETAQDFALLQVEREYIC